MAGYARFTVVLDACVLYPAPLRDLLLSLGEAGLYRPRWTEAIQNEWIENLLKNRPDLDRNALYRTAAMMTESIEDCIIENSESLIEGLRLPDPNDRHVLAAAIVGHADAIITANLKDFPPPLIKPYGIEVLHPDDFLLAQYDLNQIAFLRVVKQLRGRLRRPPKSALEFISTLEQQGLPLTCLLLRDASHLI
jgi:predicted nucleic acid-binding protein